MYLKYIPVAMLYCKSNMAFYILVILACACTFDMDEFSLDLGFLCILFCLRRLLLTQLVVDGSFQLSAARFDHNHTKTKIKDWNQLTFL